jgi:hypothetical protein
MPLLVTSAAGANGDGYGALLAFDEDGKPVGVFGEDRRIVDPRGWAQKQELLFLTASIGRWPSILRAGSCEIVMG